jgi:uncharacterized protein involved in exopolysaccharide biosynthesis
LALSLAIHPKYKATATLMPPVSQTTSIMSLMMRGNLMSDPEIGGTGYMPGMVTPSDIFAYMLESGTIVDIVIRECGLVDHYKEQKAFYKRPDRTMYKIVKKLAKATEIKVTEERFITITVEDRSKAKAADIANKYGEALDRIYASMNMTQGGKMREFIDKRVVQEQTALLEMEDSLKHFQERYRTVSITDEMKAVIEMSAQLEAKIIGQQIELDAIKTYSESENPQVKVLQKQIEMSRAELQNLMRGTKGSTLFVPFSQAPSIGLRFGQLTRDVKIHQEVYALLVQQLEQAKILEAKDTPKVQFLERATPPYKKSWPKRAFITIFGVTVGCIVCLAAVFLQAALIELRNDGTLMEKYQTLVSYLRG